MVNSIALIRLSNKVLGATPCLKYTIQSTRIFSFNAELNQMKTESKKPILRVKAIACPTLQKAIDEFFEWEDGESFQYTMNVCIMPSVMKDKVNDRKALSSLYFLANSITQLVRSLEPHVTPKKSRLCQN